MKTNGWIKLAIASLFLVFVLSCAIGQLDETQSWYEARVTSVIDGDTIKIQFTDKIPDACERTERVRLIGVDTPELFTEPPEFLAEEARAFSNQYYLTNILIEFDPISARRDRYGRLLAYVYKDIGAAPLNKRLIAEGYGYYYGVFAFDPINMSDFQAAESYARTNKKGIWK